LRKRQTLDNINMHGHGGHHGGGGFGGFGGFGGHHGGGGLGGFGGHGCGPYFGPRPLLGWNRWGICPGYGYGGGLGTIGALGAGALLGSALSSNSQSYNTSPEVVVVQQPQQQPNTVYVQQPQQQQQQPNTVYVQQPQQQQQYVPYYAPPTTPVQGYSMIDPNTLNLPSNAPSMDTANVHYTNEPLPRYSPYPFQTSGQFSVQLTNLPDNVTWEELEQFFGGYHITKVSIQKDGTGFVEFGDEQTYRGALNAHGSMLRGRAVQILAHQ
jgi:hypothetical protein